MLPRSCLLALAALLPADAPVSAPTEAAMKAAAEYSKSTKGQTLVVLFDGKRVFEQYDAGGAPDKVHMLASGSKSFVGLAAVSAVQDGLIRLDDPASESISEWKDVPEKAGITYRQLLTMTSGLDPSERGMARTMAWKDYAALPMVAKPGERFQYGPAHQITFAYALERKLGQESFEDYLRRRILDVIGVRLQWLGRCADGRPQVAGGGFMTARDWATFGEFIRLGGTWEGKPIVDAKRLAGCFQGTDRNPAYGLAWWLKKPVTAAHRRAIPLLSRGWGNLANSDSMPDDLVAACGAGNQRLFVIPSLKLVVVRQAQVDPGYTDLEFLSLMLGRKPSSP